MSESSGETCGYRPKKGQELQPTPARLRWHDSRFTTLEKGSDVSGCNSNEYLVPALFDPQVNGFGGVDYQQDDLSSEQLLHSVRELRRHACSQILLTLITDDWTKMMKRLAQIKKMRDADVDLRDAIAGWHIEGPFLSEKPGFCGAHPPELMIDPTQRHIEELRAITDTDPIMLTLAPERNGSIKAIERAVGLGMIISLGHTDAPKSTLDAAVKAGATGFTHLGNGCPRTLDRQDNILWRALNTPKLMKGLIPDGIHVTQDLFHVIHVASSYDEGVYYTTDAMAAAGAPPGQYRMGRLKLEVGEDRIVRLPGQSLFAGSALTPLEGLIRTATMLGSRSLLRSWESYARKSRDLMKFPGTFKIGEPATFCKIKVDKDACLISGDIYVRGERTALEIPTTH